MIKISEAYGSLARTSVVADFVELVALNGTAVTKPKLVDWLKDNAQFAALSEKLTTIEQSDGLDDDDDDDDELEDAGATKDALFQEAATRTFNTLLERQTILGKRYPFVATGTKLERGTKTARRDSSYLALLALTVAHAFNVKTTGLVPFKVFEEVVAEALASRIDATVNFGALRRRHSDFRSALEAAREELRFGPAQSEAVLHTNAVDSGVDVLAHLGWGDQLRRGLWVFLGQVTVGSSDSWTRKAKEPSIGTWCALTSSKVNPVPFLAIPHHMEGRHLDSVVGDQVMVLDRLRLVPYVKGGKKQLRAILRAVKDAGVEFA